MKKKLLLIALPALMTLAGCSGVSDKLVEKNSNVSLDSTMVEDNLAHEELFGDALIRDPSIRRMPEVGDNAKYKIGYQLHYDSVADEMSIRFVAAINDDYAQMRWSRGLANGNGTEAKPFTNEKSTGVYFDSTQVYTSLSNGGADVMIAEQGDFTEFNGFIVYSLTNIPYDTYKDSYLAVSLTLDPDTGVSSDEIVTPVYAVKVQYDEGDQDSSFHTFSFPSNYDCYFLNGNINGSIKNIKADYPTRSTNNKASFTTYFKTGDEFLIVKKGDHEFKVWDSSIIKKAADVNSHFAGTEDKIITSSGEGNIRLYLNNDYILYAGNYFDATAGVGKFIRGSFNNWLNNPAADPCDDYELLNDGGDSQGVIYNVTIAKDAEFKISGSVDSKPDWSGGSWGNGTGTACRITGDAKDNFSNSTDSNANIVCNTAGTYNIMLQSDHNIYIWEA